MASVKFNSSPLSLTLEQIQQDMADMVRKQLESEAERIMFGHYSEPITARVDDRNPETLRVSFEVSMRELMLRHDRDIIKQVVANAVNQISAEVATSIMCGPFQKMIEAEVAAAIRAEVKQQVAAAVADRVDEFLEEALG